MKLGSISLTSLLTLAISPTAWASVLVVDSAGSGFTQIQPAIDAAIDGDTILIKTGSYGSFVVHGKGLSIVGDQGANVQLFGSIRAGNLVPGKNLVLANLTANGDTQTKYGLYLSNIGEVCVCRIVISSAVPGFFRLAVFGYDAVRIEGCQDVSLTRIVATGGASSVYHGANNLLSGAGVHALQSVVTIFDSTLEGGTGASASPNAFNESGGAGGHGCWLDHSWSFASGSHFTGANGGNGGAGFFLADAYGGDGGNGILLENMSHGFALEDTFAPGTGGFAGNGPESFEGKDGSASFVDFNSTLTSVIGTSKHLVAPTPVRENTTATLTLSGTPGDVVSLLIARQPGFEYDPEGSGHSGALMLAAPFRTISLGIIPAGGTLTTVLPAITLGPQLDSLVLQLQARFVDGQGRAVLSGPNTLVILDQSF